MFVWAAEMKCVCVCFGKFPSLSRECVFCFMSHKRALVPCSAYGCLWFNFNTSRDTALTENAF